MRSKRPLPPPQRYAPVDFIAVDPGKAAGWATFDRLGNLTNCGLAKAPDFAGIPGFLGPPDGVRWPLLVIERPHEGKGRASKGDIITLAARMGELKRAVHALRVEEIEPVRWKGTIEKAIMTERIWQSLSAKDRETFHFYAGLVAQSLQHNILDAVGLGKWWLRTHGVAC